MESVERLLHEGLDLVIAEVADGAFVSVVDVVTGLESTSLDVETNFLIGIAERHSVGGQAIDLFDREHRIVHRVVEEVNRLAANGMPFRDAYKKVGLDIEAGNFHADKNIHHTHEGSIGNLCNDKIQQLMEQTMDGFHFEQMTQAENQLLGR